jgi:translation initiation factor 4B
MDLGSFLQDDKFGGGDSWADDEIDFSSIEISVKQQPSGSTGFSGGANLRDPAFGGDSRRRDDQEYPIPESAPYKARVNNLPWDVNENDVSSWIANYLQDDAAIINLVAPADFADPSRLKGFAFVTFQTKDQLKKALGLSGTPLNGRNVYVSVAAPDRDRGGFGRRDEPELDWGAARDTHTSRPQREMRAPREDRPRREEPDIDWSSARGSQGPRPPREPREDRPPRAEEPELDWGSARGSAGPRPPREPRADRPPRREEPEIDWSSARGSQGPRPPREPRAERPPRAEEPELDWGSARGSAGPRPAREPRVFRSDKPKKDEPEFDWANARGTGVPSKQTRTYQAPHKQQQQQHTHHEEKPAAAAAPPAAVVKPSFSVLANEGDDDDEEDEEEQKEEAKSNTDNDVTQLEKATSKLAVDESGDQWVVVGKK